MNRRILAASAALCLVAACGVHPAFAALDTTTGSHVDLAPILNPVIQFVGLVLAGSVTTASVLAVNWLLKRMKLAQIHVDAGLQAKIDAGAQAVIGGAITRAQLQPGQLTIDIHNQVIADAANKLATTFGDTLTKLGAKDNVAAAVSIVENRLGIMTAEANGTPIPGPAGAAPVAAPLVITPAAKA